MHNLVLRDIRASPMCPFYFTQVETLEHALFLCPHARATWILSPCIYKPVLAGFSNFSVWWGTL